MGKLCNNADGLIWSTEGRFSALTELRYASLVVNQTTAGAEPCQHKLRKPIKRASI